MFNQSIVFEQPVNELIRACLRLEYLLQFAQHGLRGNSANDSHFTVAALMDILTITDRPDLRGKFIKEFLRQSSNLQRFVNDEQIDQEKLTTALSELDKTIQLLQSNTGKFAPALRDNEFLTGIRQHLATPGGSCSFDTPAFFYWLQQPLKERQAALVSWLSHVEDIFNAVNFMLRLVRQSAQANLHTAHGGFYQASLDPQMPCQMIRVAIPNDFDVFPEISVGRHGVSIRCFYPTIKGRPAPYEKDVQFRLSLCIL